MSYEHCRAFGVQIAPRKPGSTGRTSLIPGCRTAVCWRLTLLRWTSVFSGSTASSLWPEGSRQTVRTASSQIVAVVPDFAFDAGLHEIRPALYVGSTPDARSRYRLISVKLRGRDIPETLEAIDRISADSATGAESAPERFFLNQYIQNLYLVVLREAQALGAFAAVAIVLACLGLVGLSAATVESRTREIGIRKAMGAGSSDILRMLLWQFSKPILWANLVAWPVSALLLNRWLEGFADHIDLSPLTFVAAGALALIIAVATVASHATLVARARPVEALRYE